MGSILSDENPREDPPVIKLLNSIKVEDVIRSQDCVVLHEADTIERCIKVYILEFAQELSV